MKITIISDTHGRHKELTKDLVGGDILIHCGDSMNSGRDKREIITFLDWFSSLDMYEHKIFIAGNHCRIFEDYPKVVAEILSGYENVTYLQDNEITVKGLKIYGTPWQPWFYDWAFNLPRGGKDLKDKWDMIPEDTDILITHSPPQTILDVVEGRESDYLGCELLFRRVEEVRPKLHCFGHIHSSYGTLRDGETLFVNASNLNEDYDYVNKPIHFVYDKEGEIFMETLN